MSMLDGVGKSGTTLVGNCNAGVTSSTQKGYYGKFQMWINKNGMANLLYIPCLEQEGYHIKYYSYEEWVVKTPQGVIIPFKRDTGVTRGMPYIGMREWKEGFGMIETVRKNF